MAALTEILTRLRGGSPATDADIAAMLRAARDWPASPLTPAMLLKYAPDALDEAATASMRARVALGGGDPTALIDFIDPSGMGYDSFYPPRAADNRPATENAIDTFLATYGHRSAEEDALLERMIFNPVPDYAETLARQNPAEAPAPAATDPHASLIDAFLSANPPETPRHDDGGEVPLEAPAPESVVPQPAPKVRRADKRQTRKDGEPRPELLSESLARIFIKQGRYERAFEIITNLSLNYPEKSVYFADQLRFLQKLMINRSHDPARGQGTTSD